MNSTTPTLSPLRQRLLDDMRMRKLSPKTQNGYIRTVSRLYGWLGRSPDTATAEDLRRYQLHLVEHGISPISLNVTITGLKFFFESTLDRPELMRHSLKHRTILTTAYAAGLRVTEATHLKVTDIDSGRMMLRVDQGKP